MTPAIGSSSACCGICAQAPLQFGGTQLQHLRMLVKDNTELCSLQQLPLVKEAILLKFTYFPNEATHTHWVVHMRAFLLYHLPTQEKSERLSSQRMSQSVFWGLCCNCFFVQLLPLPSLPSLRPCMCCSRDCFTTNFLHVNIRMWFPEKLKQLLPRWCLQSRLYNKIYNNPTLVSWPWGHHQRHWELLTYGFSVTNKTFVQWWNDDFPVWRTAFMGAIYQAFERFGENNNAKDYGTWWS